MARFGRIEAAVALARVTGEETEAGAGVREWGGRARGRCGSDPEGIQARRWPAGIGGYWRGRGRPCSASASGREGARRGQEHAGEWTGRRRGCGGPRHRWGGTADRGKTEGRTAARTHPEGSQLPSLRQGQAPRAPAVTTVVLLPHLDLRDLVKAESHPVCQPWQQRAPKPEAAQATALPLARELGLLDLLVVLTLVQGPRQKG